MATTQKPNPIEQLQSDINRAQFELDSLQDKVRLTNLRDRLEDVDTKVRGLPQRIKNLRNQNYVFEKDLEKRAEDIFKRWGSVRPSVQSRLSIEGPQLAASIRPVEAQMARLASLSRSPAAARPVLSQLKSQISSLDSKASALERSLTGMFDTIESEFSAFDKHLEQVEWMLEQLSVACFQLLPTECGVAAVKATWYRDAKEDKEDPDGILYLSDQRLIFEQKEEVATKKVLFITTETKTVQQLQFEFAVSQIAEVKAYKKGMFKNEDTLEFRLKPNSPFDMVYLHLYGQDCEDWKALIGSVYTGDFDKKRAVAVDQAVVEKVKSAPTTCESCGGSLNQPVLRGQDTITCPYCGSVVRI